MCIVQPINLHKNSEYKCSSKKIWINHSTYGRKLISNVEIRWKIKSISFKQRTRIHVYKPLVLQNKLTLIFISWWFGVFQMFISIFKHIFFQMYTIDRLRWLSMLQKRYDIEIYIIWNAIEILSARNIYISLTKKKLTRWTYYYKKLLKCNGEKLYGVK